MITFLTCQNFAVSAFRLDSRRLHKQCIESVDILKALRNGVRMNYPQEKMWKGFEWVLGAYNLAHCNQALQRGNSIGKTMALQTDAWLSPTEKPLAHALVRVMEKDFTPNFDHVRWKLSRSQFPAWWGEVLLYRSHQGNLLRKAHVGLLSDPAYYGHWAKLYETWWPVIPDLDSYLWYPSKES